jgi:hypothetical protein
MADDPRVAVAIAEERRKNEEAVGHHPVVPQEEWGKQRLKLMEKEKQHMRNGDPLLTLELLCRAAAVEESEPLRGQKTSHAVAVYHRVIERDIRAASRHELCAADRREDSPCPRLTLLRADHFPG